MAVKLPEGFVASGISAGLKRSGKPDFGLIHSDGPLNWALLSTTNLVHAACVARNRFLLGGGDNVRAVVVNSGNANCATGEQGALDNDAMAAAVAAHLGLAGPDEVLTASTGVVGLRMPVDAILAGVRPLAEAGGDESDGFARAILTTDLTLKQSAVDLPGGARVVGVAKGSGMIHPNMATMLAFVMTDAQVSQAELRQIWQDVAVATFNQVTVDGDTSPNDMAMVLASNRVPADRDDLAAALRQVADELARMIARDGEGATKLITVRVTGAFSDDEARLAARTVAGSPLTKAAVHGSDPNWGRILVALGRSGAQFDPARCHIAVQDVPVYGGAPLPFDEARTSALMESPDVLIGVDLKMGGGQGNAYGCDLTADYVRINADYRT